MNQKNKSSQKNLFSKKNHRSHQKKTKIPPKINQKSHGQVTTDSAASATSKTGMSKTNLMTQTKITMPKMMPGAQNGAKKLK